MIFLKRRVVWVVVLLSALTLGAGAQTVTEVIFPQYIQGLNGTNNDRIPFAFRATISGLTPSATYYYYNKCVISTTAADNDGFGNPIFPNESAAFTRTGSPSMSSSSGHGSFTADSSGNYTAWFITEPTGNTGFAPGNQVFMRISLNNGAGGTTVATRLTTTQFAKVINWGTTASATEGTGLIGNTSLAAKSMVFLYDNTAGMGRPIAGTLVETDGMDLPDANYVDFYDTQVDLVDNAFGVIIPNLLSTGIQRIEGRSLADGTITEAFTSATGEWAPGSTSTVSPTGGKTAPLSINVGLLDNPNIYVSTTPLYFASTSSSQHSQSDFTIQNTGASLALNVTDMAFSGPGAAKFSVITGIPTTIAAGGSTVILLEYNPDGSTALTSATLTITSNDTSGDKPEIVVYGVAAPDMTPYAGLFISEIVTQPTADEYVEIVNVAGAAIDLSGVILSDEDTNNSEGAVLFPAGTQILPNEVILVAVNNSATEPSWLDSLPASVRVFYEPARNASTWTAANGNPLIAMLNYPTAAGGTSDAIALSSGDGVALYAPGTRFVADLGPFPAYATIDGLNYPQGDTGPSNPINGNGLVDVPDKKAGSAQPASGKSLVRASADTNINSFLMFTESEAMTPGTSPLVTVSAVDGWCVY